MRIVSTLTHFYSSESKICHGPTLHQSYSSISTSFMSSSGFQTPPGIEMPEDSHFTQAEKEAHYAPPPPLLSEFHSKANYRCSDQKQWLLLCGCRIWMQIRSPTFLLTIFWKHRAPGQSMTVPHEQWHVSVLLSKGRLKGVLNRSQTHGSPKKQQRRCNGKD